MDLDGEGKGKGKLDDHIVKGASINEKIFPADDIFSGASQLPSSYICGTILNALMHDRVLFDMRGWIKQILHNILDHSDDF